MVTRGCLVQMGVRLTDAELDACFSQWDVDGDGLLSYQEFVTAVDNAVDCSTTYDSTLDINIAMKPVMPGVIVHPPVSMEASDTSIRDTIRAVITKKYASIAAAFVAYHHSGSLRPCLSLDELLDGVRKYVLPCSQCTPTPVPDDVGYTSHAHTHTHAYACNFPVMCSDGVRVSREVLQRIAARFVGHPYRDSVAHIEERIFGQSPGTPGTPGTPRKSSGRMAKAERGALYLTYDEFYAFATGSYDTILP